MKAKLYDRLSLNENARVMEAGAGFGLAAIPGVVLVIHEADYNTESEALREAPRLSHCGNLLEQGMYESLLNDSGLVDVSIQGLHANLPLRRLLGLLGAVPYAFVKLFGLQQRFPNIMAGVEAYRHRDLGRYSSLRAMKLA
ncbi:hypothetical protein LTR49_027244 [Elasticomyces elasticus]|nr:hypothetical protein LTR49_027244 [Elasticomyces elasticus]